MNEIFLRHRTAIESGYARWPAYCRRETWLQFARRVSFRGCPPSPDCELTVWYPTPSVPPPIFSRRGLLPLLRWKCRQCFRDNLALRLVSNAWQPAPRPDATTTFRFLSELVSWCVEFKFWLNILI